MQGFGLEGSVRDTVQSILKLAGSFAKAQCARFEIVRENVIVLDGAISGIGRTILRLLGTRSLLNMLFGMRKRMRHEKWDLSPY